MRVTSWDTDLRSRLARARSFRYKASGKFLMFSVAT
jgi:hypothetical protein